MDETIPEPLGAAHTDPMAAFPAVREAIWKTWKHYEGMTTEEVQLDRYSKFRALGQYEEFLVTGGRNVEAREALDKAPGAYTAAGTWAPTLDDAKFIEMLADMDEKWQTTLEAKREWTKKPRSPPGVNTRGVLELAAAAVEARRRREGGLASGVASNGAQLAPAETK